VYRIASSLDFGLYETSIYRAAIEGTRGASESIDLGLGRC